MQERLLVVEDDASIREVVKLGLEGAGFQVTATGDGQEALALFRRDAFDLVVLDVMLPSLDGLAQHSLEALHSAVNNRLILEARERGRPRTAHPGADHRRDRPTHRRLVASRRRTKERRAFRNDSLRLTNGSILAAQR